MVLLSLAAVTMSCGLLFVVSSLFSNFIEAIENSTNSSMGDIIIYAPHGSRIGKYNALIEQLESASNIKAATPVLSTEGAALYLGPGNVRAVQIWGIDLKSRAGISDIQSSLLKQSKAGTKPSFKVESEKGLPGGFIGIGLIAPPDEKTDLYDFDKAQEYIGRTMLLTTATSENKKPLTIKFTAADVVFSGVYYFDKSFVYLPIKLVCEKLYPSEGLCCDMIQIRLADSSDTEASLAIVRGIWNKFAKDQLSWPVYKIAMAEIQTSRQMQSRLIVEYKKQMDMLIVIFGIVSLGIIMLIFCIFYLIVITKQKDIAIIKSCGLGSMTILNTFTVFGAAIGIAGSAAGLGAGYLISKNINTIEPLISSALGLKLWKSSTYMFSAIPEGFDFAAAYWIIPAAVIASAVGALIPAITAAKVNPVKILRYE